MATELDWSVREVLWNLVPEAREEIAKFEEIVRRSDEIILAMENGGEFGVGEWDELELGLRGVVPVGTLIPIILYGNVLRPELEGEQSSVVLQGCAAFEKTLHDYPELDYLILDIADYFQVVRKSWEPFRGYAGPILRQRMSLEGLS